MRIRRSVTRFFAALVIPAICGAAIAYFGYYAVWGTRGLLALTQTQARLSVRQEQLADLEGKRQRLQHRIRLLEPGSVDPDMVREVEHSQLFEGAPDEVQVPRHSR
jgi:cell division protein FtsB